MAASVEVGDCNAVGPWAQAAGTGAGSSAGASHAKRDTTTGKQICWSANFYLFCAVHSMSSAAAHTALHLAPFVLAWDTVHVGLGIVSLVTVISSVPAGPFISMLGPKPAVVLAMALMVPYFAGYAAAACVDNEGPWQLPLWLVGGSCAALSMALVQASCGPWVDRTARLCCGADGDLNFTEVSGQLLANKSFIGASFQVAFVLGLWALQHLLHCSFPACILVLGCIALLSLPLMLIVREPPDTAGGKKVRTINGEVLVFYRFYTDPRAWLLAVGPLAVGLTGAWTQTGLTLVLEKTIGKREVSTVNLVELSTVIICSKVLEKVMKRVGVAPVLWLGTLSLLAAPLLREFTPLALQGWWILVLFCLVGLDTAVENTAIHLTVLEHFSGEKSAVAFAATTMEGLIGKAVFHFMVISGRLSKKDGVRLMFWCIIALALVMMPAFYAASYLKRQSDRGPTSSESGSGCSV